MSSIGVVGSGYVGLASAVGFAHLGHDVVAFDVDADRVGGLNAGLPPFFEERLEELLNEGITRGRLRFRLIEEADVVDVSDREFVFLCLPTPQAPDGSADLTAVYAGVEAISGTLSAGTVVVNKSTVPVGTGRNIAALLDRRDVAVVSNPEFLQEGRALSEFLGGERILIGADDAIAAKRVEALYAGTGVPVISIGLESAELAKYACNTYLATKLSFVNSIATLCEQMGADISEVTTVMGSDSRIGAKFLSAGPAWGGPCFPKDSRALLKMSAQAGFDFPVLSGALTTNARGIESVVDKVIRACNGDLTGTVIAVWGLTFKAGTDDLRDSPALDVVRRLVERGAVVRAFDPMIRRPHPGIVVSDDAYGICTDAEILVVLTEWPEFAAMDFVRVASLMASPTLIDTRNIVPADAVTAAGMNYLGLGRAPRQANYEVAQEHSSASLAG